MGFFGSLTGSDQKKAIRKTTAKADQMLSTGASAAGQQMNKGFADQSAALKRGYTGARSDIGAGFNQARTDLSGQYGSAENALTDARSYVEQILAPFIQSGTGAQALYDQALGLQGQPAAQSFYDTYAANDPFRQFNEDMANKAIERSFNAGGNLGSGRAALAASRANLERGSQDLNKYLDRLASQGAQGGQYASQVANVGANTGQALANIRTGLGDRLGTLEQNRGTAMGELGYRYGSDQGAIAANRGQANAGLTYGLAQQRAGNQIGKGNAIANIQGQSANNLIGLGSAVISGMTPGAYGTSAFGNMFNGMKNWT